MTASRFLALGALFALAACATPENIIEPSTHHNDPLVPLVIGDAGVDLVKL